MASEAGGHDVSAQLRVDLSRYKAELREADRMQAQAEERAAARAARIGRFLDEANQRTSALERRVSGIAQRLQSAGRSEIRRGALAGAAYLGSEIDLGIPDGLQNIGGAAVTGGAVGGLPGAFAGAVLASAAEILKALPIVRQVMDRLHTLKEYRALIERNNEQMRTMMKDMEEYIRKTMEVSKAELRQEARRLKEDTEEQIWLGSQYVGD